MSTKVAISLSRHEVPVKAPYRLDLTVSVLRRLSTNLVDVLTEHGQYVRVLGRVQQARDRSRHADAPGHAHGHARGG